MSEAFSWVVHQNKFTSSSMSFRPRRAVVPVQFGTKWWKPTAAERDEPYYRDKPNGDPTWTHDGPHRKAMNYTHIHDRLRKGLPLPLLDAAGAYSLVDFLMELISKGEWANSHITFDRACRDGLSESHETELSLALQYMSVRQGGEFNFGISHEKRDVTHHRDIDGNVQLVKQQHKTIKTSATRTCGTVHTARLCWGEDNATLYHTTNFDEAVFLKKDDAGLLAGFWEIPMPDLETNGHVSTTAHPTWPSTGSIQRGTIELHETGENGFAELFTAVVAADHPQLQAHMPATTIHPMTQAPPSNTALQHLLLAVDDAL